MIKTKGFEKLLGQSVNFWLKDGSNKLVKVQGGTTNRVYGYDDEGLDVSIKKSEIEGWNRNE